MSQRTIYLPAIERRVSLGVYIAAIKSAKAHPDQTFKHGLTTFLAQFRDGMQDRINQGTPYHRRGRLTQRSQAQP